MFAVINVISSLEKKIDGDLRQRTPGENLGDENLNKDVKCESMTNSS